MIDEIKLLCEKPAGEEIDALPLSKPDAETVEQQIQRQLKALNYQNKLSEIIGQWPGEESIDEIINGLTF